MDSTTLRTQKTEGKTFASITSKQLVKHPSKEQGLVFSSISGVPQQAYIEKIAEIVGPKNITFAGRISNNRFVLYLTSKELVDDIVTNHRHIKIGDEQITLRKLVNPAKRYIISNLCPSVPHSVIEEVLTALNVKLVSGVQYLGAGIKGFEHILGLRRQIYLTPETAEFIPDTTVISYEGTSYRIFFTEDVGACFRCKKTGHIASQCPTLNPTIDIDSHDLHPDTKINEILPSETNVSVSKSPPSQSSSNEPLSDQISTINEPEIVVNLNPTCSKPLNREIEPSDKQNKMLDNSNSIVPDAQTDISGSKLTIDTKDSIINQLKPLKSVMETTPNKFIFSFDQLQSFLETVASTKDPVTTSLQLTDDLNKIVQMLISLYPHLQNKGIKSRFTKITKSLNSYIKNLPKD